MCCMLSSVHLPLTCQQRPPCFVFANCHPRCAEQLFGQQALEKTHSQSDLHEHSLYPDIFTELRGFQLDCCSAIWRACWPLYCNYYNDGYFYFYCCIISLTKFPWLHSQSLEFHSFSLLPVKMQGYGNVSFNVMSLLFLPLFANLICLIHNKQSLTAEVIADFFRIARLKNTDIHSITSLWGTPS